MSNIRELLQELVDKYDAGEAGYRMASTMQKAKEALKEPDTAEEAYRTAISTFLDEADAGGTPSYAGLRAVLKMYKP